jgi:hypothetical protein
MPAGDVNRFDRPRLLNVLDLNLAAVNVDHFDGIAALVGSHPKPQLVLVDVRDSTAVDVIRSVKLPAETYATGVAIGPKYLVVAGHGNQPLIFERNTYLSH